jgi:DNA-binding NtrC family response regulator
MLGNWHLSSSMIQCPDPASPLRSDTRIDLAVAKAAPLPATLPLPCQQVDDFERALIERAPAAASHNVAQTADNLGVPRKTLYGKLKKYQIGTRRT